MKCRFNNAMKKMLALFMVVLMLMSGVITAYAEDKIVFKITDQKGNKINLNSQDPKDAIKPGSKLILDYTIYPEDIVPEEDGKTTFDVTFVVDVSGTMGMYDIKNRKYEAAHYFQVFESEMTYKEGNNTYVKGADKNKFEFTDQDKLKESFENYFLQRYYVYDDDKWYTEQEMDKYYKMSNAKRAIKSFVDKVDKNKDYDARVSVINFSDTAFDDSKGISYTKFQSIGKNKNEINKFIDGIKVTGYATNGGDGMRLTYYLNKNNDTDNDKYLVYLSDGMSNNHSYTKWWGNFYFGEGNITDVEEGNYRVQPGIGITEEEVAGEKYLLTVASELINKSNIDKTYVVGIGDQLSEAQSSQNKKNASISNGYELYDKENNKIIGYNSDKGITGKNFKEMLEEVYYPAKTTRELGDILDDIAKDIFKNIKAKDVKVSLPFITKIGFEDKLVGSIGSETILIDKVDVSKVVKGKNVKLDSEFVVNTVVENGKTVYKLDGDITDGFDFYYNKEAKAYKADPINIKVYVEVPEKFAGNSIETYKDKGVFSYKVSGQEKTCELPNKNIAVGGTIVNLVDATFVIDEFSNSAQLDFKALSNFKAISIVNKQKQIINEEWKWNNLKKDDKKIVDFSEEIIQSLRSDKYFYIEIESHNSNLKLYERVEVITNDGVINSDRNYPNENGKYLYAKKVGLKIGASSPDEIENTGEDKASFSIKYKNTKSSNNYEYVGQNINNSGYYEHEIVLCDSDVLKAIKEDGKIDTGKISNIVDIKSDEMENIKKIATDDKGRNPVEIEVINAYENKTVLKAAVTVYTRGPVVKDVKVNESILTVAITDDSKDLEEASITLKNGENIKGVLSADRRSFTVNIKDKDISQFDIDLLDINKNASKTPYQMSADLNAGLYNNKNKSFIEDGKIYLNSRVMYAIELDYVGYGDIVLDAYDKYDASNKVPIKITSHSLVEIKDGKETEIDVSKLKYTVDGSGKIVFKGNNLPAGKYKVVIGTIFEKARNSQKLKVVDEKSYVRVRTTYQNKEKLVDLENISPSIV